MKMSRNEFKQLMKECLVEILAEGLGSSNRLKEDLDRQHTTENKKTSLDSIAYGQKRPAPQFDRQQISEKITNGDQVLASILADTAATTLPVMLMNEGRNQPPLPAGSIENAIAFKNPEEIFGNETASKWAELAFSKVSKKF